MNGLHHYITSSSKVQGFSQKKHNHFTVTMSVADFL